jgi:myo-inositol 2-dehydrogenase / D-chiro-inositol 1-dehydrogenase
MVFDVLGEAAQQTASELGVKSARSLDEVWSDRNIRAVLVATPTDTHVPLITAAVRAGKAVLCEKPIDVDLERARACWSEIAGGQPIVMIGFNRRFDPSYAALRERLSRGEIGSLELAVITNRDPAPPPASYIKASGGLLRDMTIHDFDMARYILGEEPEVITATASRLVAPAPMEKLGDYDTVTVLMTTASGKQAIITNSREAAYGYDQRVEAFGSKGMAVSENRRPHQMLLSGEGYSNHAAPLLHFFIERYREAFDAEIDAFVEAVETRRPPVVGFDDGRRALVLAEAALRSIAEGRAVKVSEVD